MVSVLEQDHRELEYLVVDGGSTDGSVEIINQYADRLTWWVSETDSGQADAVNKGLRHTRGEIVAWLNSDDFYLPGAISAAVRAFDAHPSAVLVYGNVRAVDEHNRIINAPHYHQVTLEDLLRFQIIGQPAAFIRRSAFVGSGGLDSSLHFLLDHQLWIKLACRGDILFVNETWAAARYHAMAKNRARALAFGREAFRILDWASSEPSIATVLKPIERRARASAHRIDARYLLDGEQPGAALAAWARAFSIHPPTALSRLNLLVSALLELAGLGAARRAILRARQKRLSA
jgi:glycosyltransferase involved in cell wall biosynthesis